MAGTKQVVSKIEGDERFYEVEQDKQEALTEMESTYDGVIGGADSFYNDLIQESKDWAETQTNIQNEQTDFAIEQIEQTKEQAKSDYLKEQSGAYADWQKQSAQHGIDAEKKAAAGVTNTGYSESSQVSMYNTYQNRVATARESFNRAILNYDNAIKDARLQNNANLAQIAHDALQQQLELALEGFQYKNTLVLEKANKKLEIDNMYYQRWQDVLNQINTENALAEQIRQFNQSYDLQLKEYKEGIRQFNAELERLKKKDTEEAKLAAQELELKKQQLAQEQKQWEAEMKLEREKLAETQRQFNESQKQSASISKGSSGSSSSSSSSNKGGSSSSSGSISSNNKKYEVNTDYYQGSKNPDCAKYGTFSNGYQPKGISGHGKLSKSGKTVTIETQTRSGQRKTVTQNVWKAADGTLWYWEGRQNKYIQIKQKGGAGAIAGGAAMTLRD